MSGQVTLDAFPQDPEFVGVQRGYRRQYPEQWRTVEFELQLAARELVEFTADDVMDRVGRSSVPRNLIGSVIGAWRSAGRLRVVGREKARHRAAKGRWLNRFIMVEANA